MRKEQTPEIVIVAEENEEQYQYIDESRLSPCPPYFSYTTSGFRSPYSGMTVPNFFNYGGRDAGINSSLDADSLSVPPASPCSSLLSISSPGSSQGSALPNSPYPTTSTEYSSSSDDLRYFSDVPAADPYAHSTYRSSPATVPYQPPQHEWSGGQPLPIAQRTQAPPLRLGVPSQTPTTPSPLPRSHISLAPAFEERPMLLSMNPQPQCPYISNLSMLMGTTLQPTQPLAHFPYPSTPALSPSAGDPPFAWGVPPVSPYQTARSVLRSVSPPPIRRRNRDDPVNALSSTMHHLAMGSQATTSDIAPPAPGPSNFDDNVASTSQGGPVRPTGFRWRIGSDLLRQKKKKKRGPGARGQYVCPVPGCGGDFTVKARLDSHMMSHAGEASKGACNQCGRRLWPWNMRRHKETSCSAGHTDR